MHEHHALTLSLLADDDGLSVAALRKRLEVPMSVLLRVLTELGELALVERRAVGRREGIFLTDKARALLQAGSPT
jgi:DNA-binding MarR family transcriptional regulator